MRSAEVLTGRSIVGRHFLFAVIAAFGAVMATVVSSPARAQFQSGSPSVSSNALKAEFGRLVREKRHQDAVRVALEILAHAKARPGQAAHEIAYAQHNLGYALLLDEAMAPLAEAIAIYDRLGVGHPDAARAHRSIAQIHMHAGRYKQAQRHLTISLEMTRKAPRSRQEEIGLISSELGHAQLAFGRYASAEAVLKDALWILNQSRKKNADRIALTLGYLAELYRRQTRYAESQKLFERALELTKTVNGATHPRVAGIRSGLAGVHAVQAQYAKAETEYKQAIKIYRDWLRSKGASRLVLVHPLHDLALINLWQGRQDDAEPLLQEAADILRSIRGPNHPKMSNILGTLGSSNFGRGNLPRPKTPIGRPCGLHKTHPSATH